MLARSRLPEKQKAIYAGRRDKAQCESAFNCASEISYLLMIWASTILMFVVFNIGLYKIW